jgi:beta-phosphoglucomutase-like phosphatase (HAD superfamily)
MSVEALTITAIGYDVDGTMVDSEPLHVAAWRETLAINGRTSEELPEDFQHTMAGRKPLAIATFMVENLNLSVAPSDFLSQKHTNFMDKVRTDLRPMPGVVDSVRRFAGKYVLGIGTSLDRAYVDLVLDGLGVTDAFSVIVTGDEIKNGKPDPETYLTLSSRMRIRPQQMAVFEDAASGIASAKNAGCWCVAIENLEAAPQDTSRADIVVHSLNEVTDETIHRLGR